MKNPKMFLWGGGGGGGGGLGGCGVEPAVVTTG